MQQRDLPQLDPQHGSSRQSSLGQPHYFSQQQDGSHESQPQPPPSIRSSMPAPKLWPARQTLTNSAPNKLPFIEPRLLLREGQPERHLDVTALARRFTPCDCRGDRLRPRRPSGGECTGRELGRGGAEVGKAGCRGGRPHLVGGGSGRASPWLVLVTTGCRRSMGVSQ